MLVINTNKQGDNKIYANESFLAFGYPNMDDNILISHGSASVQMFGGIVNNFKFLNIPFSFQAVKIPETLWKQIEWLTEDVIVGTGNTWLWNFEWTSIIRTLLTDAPILPKKIIWRKISWYIKLNEISMRWTQVGSHYSSDVKAELDLTWGISVNLLHNDWTITKIGGTEISLPKFVNTTSASDHNIKSHTPYEVKSFSISTNGVQSKDWDYIFVEEQLKGSLKTTLVEWSGITATRAFSYKITKWGNSIENINATNWKNVLPMLCPIQISIE